MWYEIFKMANFKDDVSKSNLLALSENIILFQPFWLATLLVWRTWKIVPLSQWIITSSNILEDVTSIIYTYCSFGSTAKVGLEYWPATSMPQIWVKFWCVLKIAELGTSKRLMRNKQNTKLYPKETKIINTKLWLTLIMAEKIDIIWYRTKYYAISENHYLTLSHITPIWECYQNLSGIFWNNSGNHKA